MCDIAEQTEAAGTSHGWKVCEDSEGIKSVVCMERKGFKHMMVSV